MNCKDWDCPFRLVAQLWIDYFIFDCICHDILINGWSEADDAHFESLAAGSSFYRELHSQWYHETTAIVKLPNWAWKSLVLSVKQVVYFLFLMDAPFNYSCASLLAFSTSFWSQDPVVGWQIWEIFCFVFFLMGAQCLCSPMFCGERGFFRGGGADERGT